MKKITKILPLAMAMLLMSPAFAADSYAPNSQHSADSTMVLTVPEFINITKTSAVETATAEFDANYTTLTTNATMNANFRVITNVPNKNVYLKGTCLADGGDVPALYGGSADEEAVLNLVFANDNVKPSSADVANITGGSPAVESNPNAIAFTLTPKFTYDENTGAKKPVTAFETGKVSYTLQNGVYDVAYTLGTQALAGTFSTKDTFGTYKATLTLTDANP